MKTDRIKTPTVFELELNLARNLTATEELSELLRKVNNKLDKLNEKQFSIDYDLNTIKSSRETPLPAPKEVIINQKHSIAGTTGITLFLLYIVTLLLVFSDFSFFESNDSRYNTLKSLELREQYDDVWEQLHKEYVPNMDLEIIYKKREKIIEILKDTSEVID